MWPANAHQGDRVSDTLRHVVVVRCTERLLFRLKQFDGEPPEVSTTRLGDWYGNLLRVGQRHALLFIAERSRLPVLLPVRAADRLQKALPAAVGDMLNAVGVPHQAIEQELAHMFDFKTRPDVPLDVIARELAEVPLILPLKGEHASEVTRRLFGAK